MKLYYDEDGITIYHGDATLDWVEKSLADVMVTDPPYGIFYSSGKPGDLAQQRWPFMWEPSCSRTTSSSTGCIIGKLWIVTLVGGPAAWMLRKRLPTTEGLLPA